MRVILTTVAAASLIFACSSSSTGPAIGPDGGPISTGSSSGGTFTGSCSSLGRTYNFHFTYVSGGTQCMQGTPADQMSTIDPDAGPPSAATDAGEMCNTSLVGCSYSQSCSQADDAGNSSMITVMYNVGSDGTISGTESYSLTIDVLGQTFATMCSYTVMGTKIN